MAHTGRCFRDRRRTGRRKARQAAAFAVFRRYAPDARMIMGPLGMGGVVPRFEWLTSEMKQRLVEAYKAWQADNAVAGRA